MYVYRIKYFAYGQPEKVGHVHEKEAGGVRDGEDEVHADGIFGVLLEGLSQARSLVGLLAKGTDDAHACDRLTEARVHVVDELLKPEEDGCRPCHGHG